MSLSPFIYQDHSPSPTHDFNANRPANFLEKLLVVQGNNTEASQRLMPLHRYNALNEDSNAKQAMYWSPDGFQLIVADVGRLVAGGRRLGWRLLRFRLIAQTS